MLDAGTCCSIKRCSSPSSPTTTSLTVPTPLLMRLQADPFIACVQSWYCLHVHHSTTQTTSQTLLMQLDVARAAADMEGVFKKDGASGGPAGQQVCDQQHVLCPPVPYID